MITEAQYIELCDICFDSANDVALMLTEIISVSKIIMENHAPAAVKEHCRPIAAINTNGMAEIMGNLCENGYLMMPQRHNFLTIFIVI